jgi:hypothetical protein
LHKRHRTSHLQQKLSSFCNNILGCDRSCFISSSLSETRRRWRYSTKEMRTLMRLGTREARIIQKFCSCSGKLLRWNAQDGAHSISFVVAGVPTGIFFRRLGFVRRLGSVRMLGLRALILLCEVPQKVRMVWSWLILSIFSYLLALKLNRSVVSCFTKRTLIPLAACDYTAPVLNWLPTAELTHRVRVRVTLYLAVYRQ